MRNLQLSVEKYQILSRSLWAWGGPVLAKIWISAAFLFR
jgi:hypothetical protein